MRYLPALCAVGLWALLGAGEAAAGAGDAVIFFSLDEVVDAARNADGANVDAVSAATGLEVNVGSMAKRIASLSGAQLYRLSSDAAYPPRMNEAIGAYQEQLADGEEPALKGEVPSLKDCERIYLGYPVWLNGMPQEVRIFLRTHREELAGKTVAIFNATGSSGNTESVQEIKALLDGSSFPEPLLVRSSEAPESAAALEAFVAAVEGGTRAP